MKRSLLWLATLGISAAALAQSLPTASLPTASLPTTSPSDDALDRMLRPSGQAPAPLAPVGWPPQTTPETAAAAWYPTTQPTIREGTYLKDRTGQMSKTADGKHELFTLDPAGDPIPEVPMVIIPNYQLLLMEQATALANKPLKFRITAMLTEYRKNNYLLLDSVGTVSDGGSTAPLMASTAPALTMAAAPDAAPQTTPPATKPASASDTLDRMLHKSADAPKPLRSVSTPPGVSLSSAASVSPAIHERQVMREGYIIADRTGRLTRAPYGEWPTFTFDADSRTLQDPPVTLLPNLKLELMEMNDGNQNRDLRFRVTGQVTEYNNRNYLLLDKVMVVPDVVQQF